MGLHQVILQKAKELHPEAQPRVIYDNAPQFVEDDLKECIRVSGMTHPRTRVSHDDAPKVISLVVAARRQHATREAASPNAHPWRPQTASVSS